MEIAPSEVARGLSDTGRLRFAQISEAGISGSIPRARRGVPRASAAKRPGP